MVLSVAFCAAAQSVSIAAKDAKSHIGESTAVCGRVVSSRYAENSKGQPTFLDFDEPYPKQVFTIVIWGNDRQKFMAPEAKYKDKNICVSAKIKEYRGVPEAVVTDPRQIEIR